MPDASQAAGPTPGHCALALDMEVAEAIIVATLGPDFDALNVVRDGGETRVTVTPAGRGALAEVVAATGLPAHAAWVELLTDDLEHRFEAATSQAGPTVRAAIARMCLSRLQAVGRLASAAKTGPIMVRSDRGEIVAAIAAHVSASLSA